jgi:peptidoglycan/LPS O-acetylase OafA/YrhL
MKRLDQLTFTRFLMIMLVLFYHGGGGIYFNFLRQLPFSEILLAAPTGVSYLYVLSGFVMALVYFRPNEKFDIAGYWKARFVRIYPLYLIAFLLTCYFYADTILRIKPQKILANIFVVQAWIPAYSQSFNYAAWSMTVEFFFYAIFPFFTMWAYKQSTKKLISVSVIFWVVSQIIYQVLWVAYFPERKDTIVYNPIFHLNSFIMGVVGGIWYLREGKNQTIQAKTIFSTLFFSFMFVFIYCVVSRKNPELFPNDLQPMAGLLAPFMILFIISLSLDKSRISNMLNHPALVTLGETSYAIYILHVPIVWLFERYLHTTASISNPQQIFGASVIPMMVAIGLLAHFFVDQPLRNWLKKTLQKINIPLLLLDLIIVTASVYLSFRLRFDHPREFASYQTMMRVIFYSAFFLRTALSVYFNTFNAAVLTGNLTQMLRSVFISVTTGTIIFSVIAYIGFSIGWFENFPRSVFLMDWAIVLSLSLLTRFIYRAWMLRSQKVLIPSS